MKQFRFGILEVFGADEQSASTHADDQDASAFLNYFIENMYKNMLE
ncbi:hypothetical protein [Niallia sp. 03133]